MSKITVTGQITLAGGQLTVKETPPAVPIGPQLWAWGESTSGRLADGQTTIDTSSPVQVGALTNWASVSGLDDGGMATKTDGSLWGWGRGYNGIIGMGNTTDYSSPVQVPGSTNWNGSTITHGTRHTLGIKTDGTLWAWGKNTFFGQLGVLDKISRSSPTQIGILSDWTNTAAHTFNSAAIRSNGTIWVWGNGNNGEFGNGTAGSGNYASSPIQVGSDWADVSSGFGFITAIKTNGALWAWGSNSSGQLGHEDVAKRSSPVQIGNLTDWASIHAGRLATFAIKENGSLWAWGRNTSGELGQGDTINRSSPVQIGSDTNWASVDSGKLYHAVARKTDGSIWSWGYNQRGQLGHEDTILRSSPVQIGMDTNWTDIVGGRQHSFAIKTIT